MPIYLPAPDHQPRGPDGQGWNRLSIGWGAVYPGQCALRPTSYATLWESQDTRRARWGGFQPCVRDSSCASCPVLHPPHRRTLTATVAEVLVRLAPQPGNYDVPHVMEHAETGWASPSQRWSWTDIARLEKWRLGRQHRDEHSDGFWLHATHGSDGCYGQGDVLLPANGRMKARVPPLREPDRAHPPSRSAV